MTTPPYDKVSIARRVVRESGIRRLLLLETELWPAWLAAAFDAGVRVAVANARLSDRGWPRYRRLRSSWAPLVSRLTAVCAQTEIDAERWRELGVPAERVRVTGNTKYEAAAALEPATEDERAAARRRFGLDPNKVWCVIGSLRPGEEKWIEPALSQVSDDVDFLVVPRHPEFWRGKPLAGEGSGRVVWVLELGVLLDAYRAADFAVIGGTIGGYGGHNALEPAALGLPVVLGPSIENIREVAEALVREHGAVQAPDFHHVTSHLAFIRTLQSYGSSAVTRRKASQAARRVAESFGGAAARVIDFLEERGFWP